MVLCLLLVNTNSQVPALSIRYLASAVTAAVTSTSCELLFATPRLAPAMEAYAGAAPAAGVFAVATRSFTLRRHRGSPRSSAGQVRLVRAPPGTPGLLAGAARRLPLGSLPARAAHPHVLAHPYIGTPTAPTRPAQSISSIVHTWSNPKRI